MEIGKESVEVFWNALQEDEVTEEIGGLDSAMLSGDGKGSLVSGGGSVNEGLRSKRVRKPGDLDKLGG